MELQMVVAIWKWISSWKFSQSLCKSAFYINKWTFKKEKKTLIRWLGDTGRNKGFHFTFTVRLPAYNFLNLANLFCARKQPILKIKQMSHWETLQCPALMPQNPGKELLLWHEIRPHLATFHQKLCNNFQRYFKQPRRNHTKTATQILLGHFEIFLAQCKTHTHTQSHVSYLTVWKARD